MNTDTQQLIPCFLCGNGAEVKLTKKKKPYFICEPCGVQVFVRRENGIAHFNRLVKNLADKCLNNPTTGDQTFQIVALVNRLAELKNKLAEIRDKSGITGFLTGEFSVAENALKKEIAVIEAQLKTISA